MAEQPKRTNTVKVEDLRGLVSELRMLSRHATSEIEKEAYGVSAWRIEWLIDKAQRIENDD